MLCCGCFRSPWLTFEADFPQEMIGSIRCHLRVFRAFAVNAGITLHLGMLYGNNSHHITEALFKACARALRVAVKMKTPDCPLQRSTINDNSCNRPKDGICVD